MKKPSRRSPPKRRRPSAPPPSRLLVAFASLPFGLRGGAYLIRAGGETKTVHISDRRYHRFFSITSRPELAQWIPEDGEGAEFTTYTWYDHPFVLRVMFGHNVAALGSFNSSATIAEPLPPEVPLDDPALTERMEAFAKETLGVFNTLVALVRQKALLYHVLDLRREDIDISIRDANGTILREDPLQAQLIRQEEAESEVFDLADRDDAWYEALHTALQEGETISLADDLLIEAERALKHRFPRQAIVTCHSTVEAAVSSLLTYGMKRQGSSDEEIDDALSTRSLTAKLDVLLRRYTGFSLKRDQYALWRSFGELNDLRNDIVHRGMMPTDEQAAFAISITRDLLRWLDVVRSRNR